MIQPATFYLGVHEPSWLRISRVPLFVSRRRLDRLKTLPVARTYWGLDSGGFSELSMYGEWRTSTSQYVEEVKRWTLEVGKLRWAAQQDWMCEPFILTKTGKTMLDHQRYTVRNYLDLMSAAPALPWVPVLQGFHLDDYLRHLDMFMNHRVDLTSLDLVGIGSICRRQATAEAAEIIKRIQRVGVSLHGFGLKEKGLVQVIDNISSGDSMAWSFGARRGNIKMPGCEHRNCTNCFDYALFWREKLLAKIGAKL